MKHPFLAVLLLLSLALAQEESTAPTFTLERKEKVITMVKRGEDGSGFAIFCEPQPEVSRGVFYDPSEAAVEVTIDQNRIVAPLAIMNKKEGGDGHLEMAGGTGANDNDSCPTTNLQAAPKTLKVTQGKTKLTGSKVVYDESDGIARISGPIEFERQQKDNKKLSGKSERIEVNVDTEETVLKGQVEITSDKRVSQADEVLYSDKDNLAILKGNPATSTEGKDTLKAQTIRYNLETNDVVAVYPENKLTGTFEDQPETK